MNKHSIDRYESQIWKFDKPQITEFDGKTYIWQKFTEAPHTYDAFEEEEDRNVISECMRLATKEADIEHEEVRKRLILDWVRDWGVFTLKELQPGVYGQELDEFIYELRTFMGIWIIYRGVVNDEAELLKTAIAGAKKTGWSFDQPGSNKENAMQMVNEFIDTYIQRAELQTYRSGKNYFEIKPVIHFNNLIDVLFMQLFFALTENMKVCPVCNTPFYPKRKHQKYDREKCKNTGKSRKFRKEYEEKHGKKYWEKDEDPGFKKFNA